MLVFLAFAIATLFASLVTCVLLGVFAAFVFTFFVTGFALLFVAPVVVIGSCTAATLFFWGLVGYLILKRLNSGETPVQPGTKVGDTLNKLTSGRLREQLDQADSNSERESMALAPSQDETLHVDRGGKSNGTHRGSPHRRDDGQSSGPHHDSTHRRDEGQISGPHHGSTHRRDQGESSGSHHSSTHRRDEGQGSGTHDGSTHRRDNGQSGGLGHPGESGETGHERGRGAVSPPPPQHAQGTPQPFSEAPLTTYDPAYAKVADWKREFQQGGITA